MRRRILLRFAQIRAGGDLFSVWPKDHGTDRDIRNWRSSRDLYRTTHALLRELLQLAHGAERLVQGAVEFVDKAKLISNGVDDVGWVGLRVVDKHAHDLFAHTDVF